MIQTVIFDMGQVLLHWSPALFVDRLGLSPEDSAALTRETFGPEWLALDGGTCTEAEALAAICARLPRHLHPYAEQLVTRWWEVAFCPMEGMGDLIRELKDRGYGIYLLSNAGVNYTAYFPRIPGSQCFDGCYVSAEHRLMKPDPAIYRSFLDTFSLAPQHCLFIDDRPENIEAGAALGIRGVVFPGTAAALRQELRALGLSVLE